MFLSLTTSCYARAENNILHRAPGFTDKSTYCYVQKYTLLRYLQHPTQNPFKNMALFCLSFVAAIFIQLAWLEHVQYISRSQFLHCLQITSIKESGLSIILVTKPVKFRPSMNLQSSRQLPTVGITI